MILVSCIHYFYYQLGMRCEQESIFGITTYVDCPRSYDNPNAIFCCGSKDDVRCCDIGIDEKDFEMLAEK